MPISYLEVFAPEGAGLNVGQREWVTLSTRVCKPTCAYTVRIAAFSSSMHCTRSDKRISDLNQGVRARSSA